MPLLINIDWKILGEIAQTGRRRMMKGDSESQAMSIIRELNGSFVSYVLTTLEAVLLVDEVRQKQMKAIRKLILDRHNENLREIKKRLSV